jgi:hypothetical protein
MLVLRMFAVLLLVVSRATVAGGTSIVIVPCKRMRKKIVPVLDVVQKCHHLVPIVGQIQS